MKEEWKSIALEAAKKAGNKILEIYNTDFKVITKKDLSPVTTADLASNKILIKHLSQTSIPILTEEEDFGNYENRKNLPMLWVIDPLDGTKEFINKHDDFCINIALVENHKPIFGLIYIPTREETYFAIKGKGAFLIKGENKFELPKIKNRTNYVFLKSRSHPDKKLEDYLKQLKKKEPTLTINIVGSAVKFCDIAYGNADEYTRFNPTMEWDTAAGQIIMNEIGKTLIDHSTKKEMLYNRKNLKNNGFTVK